MASNVLKFTRNSFTQNLAAGRLLVQYLDRYDKWDQPLEFKYEPKTTDDAWHPSGDCLPSASSLYAKALDPEREAISTSLQRSFLVGHFWHAVLQKVIVEMGFAKSEAIERIGTRWWGDAAVPVIPDSWDGHHIDADGIPYYRKEDLYYRRYPEQRVHENEFIALAKKWPTNKLGNGLIRPKPYHWVAGAGDIAPLTLPSGWEGVCDIKTMNGSDWKTAQRSGLLPERFADKYEAQINVYMDLFDLEHGLILGVNKDAPHGFLEFPFDRNEALIEAIYAKWRHVADCLDSTTPPAEDMEFELSFGGPIG